ncbi:hypothetical protein Pla110_42210 [Polystyrenella longa]|uniref:Uncharacterized protein n=2 Tax=Polystyrenella longa TaxID=2528007 RepID=A0A518CTF6_9PLAN|nr:hypothetical protein Pla110_42210 [Polystyrenella longa]
MDFLVTLFCRINHVLIQAPRRKQVPIAFAAEILEQRVMLSATLTVDSASVTVEQGETASNNGTYYEVGNNIASLSASIGTVTDNNNGTWSWAYNTTANSDENQTVKITSTDSAGLETEVTFNLEATRITAFMRVDNVIVPINDDGTIKNQDYFTVI